MFAFLLVYYFFALWGGKRRKAEFTGRIDFRLEIMTGGRNGGEHGRPWGRVYISCARGNVQTQKSRTLPMRVRVGPTKNLLQRRTEKRPARHKDTMVPCWYFNLWSKRAILILGRFTRTFAEITDVMSSETDSGRVEPVSKEQFIPMSRESQAAFRLFWDIL